VIVNPPQIDIRGHLAVRQDPVEMFRAGFVHAQVADAVEIPVLDRHLPPPPRLIRFLGDDVFHHLLPRPGGQFGIGGVQVNARQAEADGRLAFRFVHGVDPLFRLSSHPRLEADRIARHVVEGIPHAPGAFEFPIPLRHILRFHLVRI
jgi:hypothetical protein